MDLQAIRRLSPGALRIFRQQAYEKARQGDETFTRLVSMPELSDVFQGEELPTKPSPLTSAVQTGMKWYQAPFNWIGKNITKPFAAYATSPFTPSTPESQNLPWAARERAEYAAWKEPELTMPWGGKFRPTKGAVEMIPWLLPSLIPGGQFSAIGSLGKITAAEGAALLARGVAPGLVKAAAPRGIAGLLGGLGGAGQVAGAALQYSPWGLTEAASGKLLGLAGRGVGKLLGGVGEKAIQALPEEKLGAVLPEEKLGALLPEQRGVPFDKQWDSLSGKGRRNLLTSLGISKRTAYTTKDFSLLPKFQQDVLMGLNQPLTYTDVEKGAISQLMESLKQSKTIIPEQRELVAESLMKKVEKGYLDAAKVDTNFEKINSYLAAFAGESEKVNFEPLKIANEAKEAISGLILNTKRVSDLERASVIKAFDMMLEGRSPYLSQLKLMQRALGSEVVEELIKKQPTSVANKIFQVLNAPASLLTMADESAVLRQGLFFSVSHPMQAAREILPMLKATFSDDFSQLNDSLIKQIGEKNGALEHGVGLLSLPGDVTAAYSDMPEQFVSSWLQKVPILGDIMKASHRGFSTYINNVSVKGFGNIASTWKDLGATAADLDSLGLLINSSMGRANLSPALLRATPFLNAVMFAPRWVISGPQLIQYALPGLSPLTPMAQKEASKMMVKFLGAGAAVLAFAELAGAKVEKNPLSSDFGKIRIGNTRLDIWRGYTQWARFVSQVTTGMRKTQGGEVKEANRWDTLLRFWQSKSSPAAGLLTDILKGESYMGDDMSLSTQNLRTQVFNRLTPLFVQDMIDAVNQEGVVGGVTALPGFFGVGVVTYRDPVQKLREKLSQEKYGMSWEELGQSVGKKSQLEIEKSSPELQQLIKKSDDDYARTLQGRSDVNNQWRRQTTLVEQNYRDAVEIATLEFRQTQDGNLYKQKIDSATNNRRAQYDLLSIDPALAKITGFMNNPLREQDIARMNPQDVARHEYYQALYSKDMYDEFGNYSYELADERKQQFAQAFGGDMLRYVEDYQGVKESDMPYEYSILKQAKNILKPYWEVGNQVWAQLPPNLKQIADQITVMERTDPRQAKRMLFMYPQIVWARKQIAMLKKRVKQSNPDISSALAMFY
uniref:Large polyvalent protein associated domain-containing protein n=1 Tax=viral metagenome TaxID=1070528 RepID=A0A6M3JAI3_9ZZZZ